jgi:hypothetical protein
VTFASSFVKPCSECGEAWGKHEEWCSIGRRWSLPSPPPTHIAGMITGAIVAIALWISLTSCIIGRLDSDNLRIIPLSEVHRMDVTPWHPQPATLNEIIERDNK